MKKKNKEKNSNDKYIIAIICLIVFGIFVIYHYANSNNVFDKYKLNKNKNIVFPIYSKGKTSVPNLNLKGQVIEEVNNIIVSKANDFLKGKNTITYNFEINGKILSLAIQYVDYYDEDKYPIITYDVYNINYYSSKLLSSDEMLQLYGIDKSMVKPIVEAKFGEYYNKAIEKGYYGGECDYDCFLLLRGINNNDYLENSYYYIKNGNLYILKPFKIYSPFSEEKFFSTNDFLIQITE